MSCTRRRASTTTSKVFGATRGRLNRRRQRSRGKKRLRENSVAQGWWTWSCSNRCRRRAQSRNGGTTEFSGVQSYTASKCPLCGQTWSQRDEFHLLVININSRFISRLPRRDARRRV